MTLIVLLFSCLHEVWCVRGPPRAEQSEVKQVAKVGESVKLRCPIHGYPAPIVSWHKDAEDAAISYAWSRYRTTRRTLKIRSVVKEDTGLYVCKGINGFGKAESRIELVVINPEDFPAMSDTELAELAEPVFTPETVRAAKEVTVAAGASVTLPCAAAGVPAPQLSWYRNSELHRDTAATSGLELARARAEDSGVYTCMAQNMVGSATLRYRLTVTAGPASDQTAHAQEAGQEVTSAVRVGRGGTALIDCRVRTHQRPSVKWLKRLEAGEVEAAEAEARTQIISVGEESYRILGDDHQLQQLGPGAWLSQLIVRGARLRDRGMYICFVTSGGRGFNFQQSYLTVIESKHPSYYISLDSSPKTSYSETNFRCYQTSPRR